MEKSTWDREAPGGSLSENKRCTLSASTEFEQLGRRGSEPAGVTVASAGPPGSHGGGPNWNDMRGYEGTPPPDLSSYGK